MVEITPKSKKLMESLETIIENRGACLGVSCDLCPFSVRNDKKSRCAKEMKARDISEENRMVLKYAKKELELYKEAFDERLKKISEKKKSKKQKTSSLSHPLRKAGRSKKDKKNVKTKKSKKSK